MQTPQYAELVSNRTGLLNPIQNPTDQAKVDRLTEDMATSGWQGPPLVTDGENALNGSHRIAAVAQAWNNNGIQVDIPVVEISELCQTHGLDWDQIQDDAGGDWHQAVAELPHRLPADVVDRLGLDVH